MTRAEMYQTVRDALDLVPDDARCRRALRALAALEAEEPDAPNISCCECCDKGLVGETRWDGSVWDVPCSECGGTGYLSTPPAPPAAECATFAEYWEQKGHLGCNPEEVAELAWGAALAAMDEQTRVQSIAKNELAAELRQAVDALRPFAKWVIEQDDPRGRSHFVRYADCVPVAESGGVNATFGDFRKAEDIVTDYDAKHGGKA